MTYSLSFVQKKHEARVLLEQKKRLTVKNKEFQRQIEELENKNSKLIADRDEKEKLATLMNRQWNHV